MQFVAYKAVPKAMNLDKVKQANSLDKTLQKAIGYLCNGIWYKLKHLEDADIDLLESQNIRNFQDELAVYSDNFLLRDGLLVLPKTLRGCAVAIARKGHKGVSSIKPLLHVR